jgi:hypothetical protein
MDFKYGISFSNSIDIETPDEIISFIRGKQRELEPLAPMLTRLLNNASQDSFGLPGEPGDYHQIQYVCQRFAEIYSKYIDWRLSFVNLNVDPDFNKLLHLVSTLQKMRSKKLKNS